MSVRGFRWQDGERTIVFGRGRVSGALSLLSGAPYVVLTTSRAAGVLPEVVEGAGAVHLVSAGRVDEVAESLRAVVAGDLLVALGGGRVIDVAKALAAAHPPRRVAAIPTTLSGAEMNAIHRHAAGVAADTPRVRPAIVINDPALSASQPVPELAQSAANALGHAAEGPLTPLSNPVAGLAAMEAARSIAGGFFLGSAGLAGASGAPASGASGAPGEPDRDALALGALLAGYVIGATGYGLHHVLSQTLARFAGVSHGAANTIMLEHSLRALERRFPAGIAQLASALGNEPTAVAARLRSLAGLDGLREAGLSPDDLDACAEQASLRPELEMTAPAADREELRALYEAAY